MEKTCENTILSARDVYKEYKIGKTYLRVLNGINLDIQEGEVVVILGASGAGKSTLLHTLGMLDTPTSGSVYFRGENLSIARQSELATKRNTVFGFVFQFYYLLPDFNALENVLMPCLIGKNLFKAKSKKENTEKAIDLLRRVGLGNRIHHRPDELSGGEKQRVAIVRALINDPEILLCDEPTGNLDTHTGREIQELILELNDRTKQTVIIVTHDERFAKSTEYIVRIADGKIVNCARN
ncbi:MAG: ABC transporter ATP-binding protein [Planctomycetes bacterium]|nr:ABC transporter ATP-binding protein [Planctomycetota bacterium]